MQGRALLTFDRDHGIFSMGGVKVQAVNIAATTPSIALPAATDVYRRLQLALGEGAHWFWVEPESDLPEIALFDSDVMEPSEFTGAGFTFDRCGQKLIRVGYEPVFIESALPRAFIMPPLARYCLGWTSATALYDIGGVSSVPANTDVDEDIFDFKVRIGFSKEKTIIRPHYGNRKYRFRNKTTVNSNALAGTDPRLNVPPMIYEDGYAHTHCGHVSAAPTPVVTWYHFSMLRDIFRSQNNLVVSTANRAISLTAVGSLTEAIQFFVMFTGAAGPQAIAADSVYEVAIGGFYV